MSCLRPITGQLKLIQRTASRQQPVLLIAEDRDRDDTTAKVSKEGEDRQRRRVHNTNSKQASFSD